LEKRGHRFGRAADDCNIYVRSARAGARVLASVTRDLTRKWTLVVNAATSAVDRPWRRTFVGFSFTGRQPNRRQVRAKALKACKQDIRRLTQRPRGGSWPQAAPEGRRYVTGWDASVGWAAAPSVFKELASWVRRRLRGYLWKPWGRRRYRELRNRGVSRDLAWNTTKSAHGPWRLSRSPALTSALPGGDVDRLGGPRLYQRPRR